METFTDYSSGACRSIDSCSDAVHPPKKAIAPAVQHGFPFRLIFLETELSSPGPDLQFLQSA